MADESDFGAKTEPPSPRRRERAREEGQFAFSRELNTGILLIVGVGGMALLAQTLGGGLLAQTRRDLALLPCTDLTVADVQQLFAGKATQALAIAGTLVGVLFLAGLAANLAQVGFNLNPAKLTLNWERIAPYNFERLLGWDKVMLGLVHLGKIAAVGAVAWWILRDRGHEIAHLSDSSLSGALAGAWSLIVRIALGLAGTLLVIGVADYAYQLWRFEQSLYMSKQELKEEHKREEGNPQVRARIRKLQRENAQRKMFHQVPRATVVVTNPTHLAVALRYEPGMAAPKVVAKGAGHIAKRIVAIARESGVPVFERKSLAQALFKTVKLEQAIPLDLYLIVAELMAHVYRLKAGMP